MGTYDLNTGSRKWDFRKSWVSLSNQRNWASEICLKNSGMEKYQTFPFFSLKNIKQVLLSDVVMPTNGSGSFFNFLGSGIFMEIPLISTMLPVRNFMEWISVSTVAGFGFIVKFLFFNEQTNVIHRIVNNTYIIAYFIK